MKELIKKILGKAISNKIHEKKLYNKKAKKSID